MSNKTLLEFQMCQTLVKTSSNGGRKQEEVPTLADSPAHRVTWQELICCTVHISPSTSINWHKYIIMHVLNRRVCGEHVQIVPVL